MFSHQGVLYFLYAEPTKKMTRYHPTLNREGHELVQKSDIGRYFANWELYDIVNAIQVGNKLWLPGRRPFSSLLNTYGYGQNDPSSYTWYHVRQKWIRGPKIPLYTKGEICLITLNHSSVMFVGGEYTNLDPSIIETIKKVHVYDFESFESIQYPYLNLYDIMFHCSGALYINKYYQRCVFKSLSS